MKKFLTALALFAFGSMAMAADVGVSAVRDSNLDQNGARVTLTTGKVLGVTPQLSVTNVDGYTRYAAGAEAGLFAVGPVKVSAAGAAVYQNTAGAGTNGYGLTAGVKAVLPLTKNIDATAGVERFYGQDRINGFNGSVATVGIVARF